MTHEALRFGRALSRDGEFDPRSRDLIARTRKRGGERLPRDRQRSGQKHGDATRHEPASLCGIHGVPGIDETTAAHVRWLMEANLQALARMDQELIVEDGRVTGASGRSAG